MRMRKKQNVIRYHVDPSLAITGEVCEKLFPGRYIPQTSSGMLYLERVSCVRPQECYTVECRNRLSRGFPISIHNFPGKNSGSLGVLTKWGRKIFATIIKIIGAFCACEICMLNFNVTLEKSFPHIFDFSTMIQHQNSRVLE